MRGRGWQGGESEVSLRWRGQGGESEVSLGVEGWRVRGECVGGHG